MYTIADLKNELGGVLHGTNLNKVQGIDVLINRAGRKLIEDIDPIETVRIEQIDNALYDQVYDYTCPADLKGDRIIDIRPQINRTMADKFAQTYNEEFDVSKATIANVSGEVTIQYDTAVKSLRIAKNLISPLLVNPATTITGTGTWSALPLATNLVNDNLNYVYGGSSLRFDVGAGAPGSTASLENSTFTAVDMSRDEDQGSLFAYVFIPDATIITNFILRWGSSNADYWQVTVTSAQNSVAFQNGWNLLRFNWNGATVVGAPVATAVDYLLFTVTYDGTADTDFRLNSITSQLGTIYEIAYYSKYLYRDFTTGAFQETVTADSNIINLDTDSYNLLFNLVGYYVSQQVQGANSSFDSAYFLKEYTDAKKRYVAKIKSQVIKPTQQYYSMPPKKRRSRRIS